MQPNYITEIAAATCGPLLINNLFLYYIHNEMGININYKYFRIITREC